VNEVIAAEGLTKTFGAVEALRGITFAVQGPQVVGILGPNGAGKTTLLEILEGITPPGTGTVRLFGAPFAASAAYPRRRVGVVLQREMTLDRITVRDYAELFAAVQGVRHGDERILAASGLAGRAATPVERLSGGEAQRLFIAAAVVHDPELLFLDEPTSGLDPISAGAFDELIRDLADSLDLTVFMITHDLDSLYTITDQVAVLADKHVVAMAPVHELEHFDHPWIHEYFGGPRGRAAGAKYDAPASPTRGAH
jgi:ABC-type multidrug transport system ATPase subunit